MGKPNLDRILDRIDKTIAESETKEGKIWPTEPEAKARSLFLRELRSRADRTLGILTFTVDGKPLFSCWHAPAGFVFSGRDDAYFVDPGPDQKKVKELIDQILFGRDWKFRMRSLTRHEEEVLRRSRD